MVLINNNSLEPKYKYLLVVRLKLKNTRKNCSTICFSILASKLLSF